MTEKERILEQLRRALTGPAWHGPALKEILADVSADRAAARPIQGAHCIGELVLHIAAWDAVVRRRLEGERIEDLPAGEDWRAFEPGADGWRRALETLEEERLSLDAAVTEFPESRLDENVPACRYSFGFMLHGVVQHDLYHAGQIALLKRMLPPA
jgi:uncharacterized damage-inducible protein DinB